MRGPPDASAELRREERVWGDEDRDAHDGRDARGKVSTADRPAIVAASRVRRRVAHDELDEPDALDVVGRDPKQLVTARDRAVLILRTELARCCHEEGHVPPVAPQGVSVPLGRLRQIDAVVAIGSDHGHARRRVVGPADGLDERGGENRLEEGIRAGRERRGPLDRAAGTKLHRMCPAAALQRVPHDKREVPLQTVRGSDTPKLVDGVSGVRLERPRDTVVPEVLVCAIIDARLGVCVGAG